MDTVEKPSDSDYRPGSSVYDLLEDLKTIYWDCYIITYAEHSVLYSRIFSDTSSLDANRAHHSKFHNSYFISLQYGTKGTKSVLLVQRIPDF
jgi:hypothetical protein